MLQNKQINKNLLRNLKLSVNFVNFEKTQFCLLFGLSESSILIVNITEIKINLFSKIKEHHEVQS